MKKSLLCALIGLLAVSGIFFSCAPAPEEEIIQPVDTPIVQTDADAPVYEFPALVTAPENYDAWTGFTVPTQQELQLCVVPPAFAPVITVKVNGVDTKACTPPLPQKYCEKFTNEWVPSTTEKVNIWVKKDWGNAKPANPTIKISLYKVVDGEDVLVQQSGLTNPQTTPYMTNTNILSYDANGNPSFGAAVTGRDLFEFKGLPKYDSEGERIVYKIAEENIPEGWIVVLPEGVDQGDFSDGKVTITDKTERVEWYSSTFYFIVRLQNVKLPDNGSVSIPVQKIWDDGSDKDGIRPDDVEFVVTAKVNGESAVVDPADYTVEKTVDGDTWSYTISGLPQYRISVAPGTRDEIGEAVREEIAYEVAEVTVTNYTTETAFDEDGVWIFTNSHEPYVPPAEPPEEPDDPNPPPPPPDTPIPPPKPSQITHLWVKKEWSGAVLSNNQFKLELYRVVDGKETLVATANNPQGNIPLLGSYNANNSINWLYDDVYKNGKRYLYTFSNIAFDDEGAVSYIVKEVFANDTIKARYTLSLPWASDQANRAGEFAVKVNSYTATTDSTLLEYTGATTGMSNVPWYWVVYLKNTEK